MSRSRAPRVAIAAALVLSTLIALTGATLAGYVASSPGATLARSDVAPVVHSDSWAINAGPTTSTPGIGVAKGSLLLVFVGYVNSLIGGGSIASIGDSSSDHFHLVESTGTLENHTQALYVADDVKRSSSLIVTVSFSGGATPQGGAISVVDITGAATHAAVGVISDAAGSGSVAAVLLSTHQKSDLFVFGVSGQAKDAPFKGTHRESLLATSGADAGPFTDGMGFGTFTSTGRTGSFSLSADLNQTAVWAGIGVGIRA